MGRGRPPGSGSNYSDTERAEALFLSDAGVSQTRIGELLGLRGGKSTVQSFIRSRDSGWVPPAVAPERREELLAMARGESIPEPLPSLLPEVAPMPSHVEVDNGDGTPPVEDVLSLYHTRLISEEVDRLRAEVAQLREDNRVMASQLVDQDELHAELAVARFDRDAAIRRTELTEQMLWLKMKDQYEPDETAEESD